MNRDAPGYVLGFMALLCVACGAAVSLVHYATRERLAMNERLHHNRTLCVAFDLPLEERTPEGYARALAERLETALTEDEAGPRRVYRRIDGEAAHWGFTFSGMGFWGRITGLLVLTENLDAIVSLHFFDHQETPGLGARIEEPSFRRAFEGLPIAWSHAEDRRLVIGTGSPADEPHRVDAISGATQTSSALMHILNRELARIRAMDRAELTFSKAGRHERQADP